MSKDIKLSPKYGVNPSILMCPVCGADGVIALHGRLKGDAEAPMRMSDRSPCEKCQADFKEYKKKGFIFFVLRDESEHLQSEPGFTPWPFFLWLSVVKKDVAKDMLTGIDMSHGAVFICRTLAEGIGLFMPENQKS